MSLSKRSYVKMEILYNKMSPAIISVIIVVNNILHYFGMALGDLIFLFIPSMLTMFHMFVSRRHLSLCKFHRTFVYYVCLNALEYIFEDIINISNELWGLIDLVTLVVFACAAIHYYYSEEHKSLICNEKDTYKVN